MFLTLQRCGKKQSLANSCRIVLQPCLIILQLKPQTTKKETKNGVFFVSLFRLLSSEKLYALFCFSNTCIKTKAETIPVKERRLKNKSLSPHFKQTIRIVAIKSPLNNHRYILKVFFDIGRSSSEIKARIFDKNSVIVYKNY